MRVVYHDAATDEAINAAVWYETRQEGLVRQFLQRWNEAEHRMVSDPKRNRAFCGDFRRCRFDVFPFTLIYRVTGDGTIQVIAVMHRHREPGYWKPRLDG